jgi:hypothetical protein
MDTLQLSRIPTTKMGMRIADYAEISNDANDAS